MKIPSFRLFDRIRPNFPAKFEAVPDTFLPDRAFEKALTYEQGGTDPLGREALRLTALHRAVAPGPNPVLHELSGYVVLPIPVLVGHVKTVCHGPHADRGTHRKRRRRRPEASTVFVHGASPSSATPSASVRIAASGRVHGVVGVNENPTHRTPS